MCDPGALPIVERLRRLPPAARAQIFAAVEKNLGVGALADVRHDFLGFWLRYTQLVSDLELGLEGGVAMPPGLVLFTGPRGDGKTQAAVVLFDRLIREGKATRPRIFAATEADVDKAVVHGASGIMSLYAPDDPQRPKFLRQEGPAGVLRYPNGVEVLCFTAKASEGAVSYNSDLDLYDDIAKWGARAETAFTHARISCRIGIALGIVATTKRGTWLLRRLMKVAKQDETPILVKRSDGLQANRFNLSPKVYRQLRLELGESDLARQELDDEDVSATSPFIGLELDKPPIRIESVQRSDLDEVVVVVDPADGKGGDHDDWGIGAAGRRPDRHIVALEDVTAQFEEDEAADAALALCWRWDATKVVAENNRGKKVVAALRAGFLRAEIEALKAGVPFERTMPEIVLVNAQDRKDLRAGPLRTLYVAGMLHHAPGLAALEKQQREWDPTGPRRPRVDDRIDWWVHGVTYLAELGGAAPGVKRDEVEGLAEAVRQRLGRGRAPAGEPALITSDRVPAGDPRSSYRPRGSHMLARRRIF